MKNKILLFLIVMYSLSLNATELKREGWNLISVCQDTNRTDIDMTGVEQIQSLDGKNIYTGAYERYSSLNTLVAGYGYWIKGSLGTNFNSGEASGKLEISLNREGWNIIGMCEERSRTDVNMTGLEQMQSLDGKNIYTGAYERYSSLNLLESGYAYWVKGTLGTTFISKNGISIPSAYSYPVYTNELIGGERVSTFSELNGYMIKFFSNEDVTITGQELQKSIIVSINGEETSEIPMASTYKGKSIVVAVYDSEEKLIAVSDVTTVSNDDFPLLIPMVIEMNDTTNTPPILTTISNQIMAEGASTLVIEVNATDADDDNITFDVNSSDPASVTASINGNQLTLTRLTSSGGTFTITVTATDDKGASDTKSFTVTLPTIVMDTENPIVTLNGSAEVNVTVGEVYTELNATVTDNIDHNLTAIVTGSVNTSSVGTYTVTYTATDTAGNIGTATRTIHVVAAPVIDTENPIVILNGSAEINVTVGEVYTELNATVTDNIDYNLTAVITGSVNTSSVGIYTVTYTVTDTAGNIGTATRTVNVVASVASFNDFNGYLYVANEGHGGGGGTTIFKVDENGTASLLADGFNGPSGLAVDALSQTLYISDDRNQVYRLLADGNLSVLPIDSTYLSNPNALVLDSYGYLLIANAGSGTIVRVDPNNTSDIQVIAEDFNTPQAVEIYGDMAYFTDFSNDIYEVNVSTTTAVNPSNSLYKSMNAYVNGTQGGLVSDFAGSLYISSYETGEVFKVDSNLNVTTVYSNPGSQPRGLLYLDEMLYVTLYNQASVARVNTNTLATEIFSDTIPFSGPFGIRYSSVNYPTFDATNPNSGGTNDVTLPVGFNYRVINNLGEYVSSQVDGYEIQLYANYIEGANDQLNHTGVVTRLNGENTPTINIQNSYRSQQIVAALYDSIGRLVSVSIPTTVDAVAPITTVDLVWDNTPQNNGFTLTDVQNKTFYTVTHKDGQPSFKSKVEFAADTRAFYTYDGTSYQLLNTVAYDVNDSGVLHVAVQINGEELYLFKKNGTSSAVMITDMFLGLGQATYYGERHFFDLEADADAYLSGSGGDNQLPTMSLNQDYVRLNIVDGSTAEVQIDANDTEDGTALTYGIECYSCFEDQVPNFVTLNGTTITVSPIAGDEGTYDVTVYVEDSEGARDNQNLHIEVVSETPAVNMEFSHNVASGSYDANATVDPTPMAGTAMYDLHFSTYNKGNELEVERFTINTLTVDISKLNLDDPNNPTWSTPENIPYLLDNGEMIIDEDGDGVDDFKIKYVGAFSDTTVLNEIAGYDIFGAGVQAYRFIYKQLQDKINFYDEQNYEYSHGNTANEFYLSLAEFIEHQQGGSWFMSKEGNEGGISFAQGSNGTSGTLIEVNQNGDITNANAGTWVINADNILVVSPNMELGYHADVFKEVSVDSETRIVRGEYQRAGEEEEFLWFNEAGKDQFLNFVSSFANSNGGGTVSDIPLPNGFEYSVINNLGTAVETEIELEGNLYTLRLHSNIDIAANDQANHVGIMISVNGQNALLQIQNSYETHNVVLAVYDNSGRRVAVSVETTVNGNTPISLTF
ncbi:DUF5011 domain-containing protein [bacterium]|nr:DUF5011 domain-containing protein [bacterium]MBU1957391.1 DUF5011 domain-containing protein [bacterium]